MSSVNPANPYDYLNAGGKAQTSADSKSAKDIQNTFLTLMIAQLRAQDPLNPMDNSQLTTQMTQINQTMGIQDLNTSMQTLVLAQAASQSLMATQLIGKSVLVPGSELTLPNAGAVTQGGVLLAQSSAEVQVQIKDSNGKVVDTLTIKPAKAGMNTFEWDGADAGGKRVPEGTYRFEVQANGLEDKNKPVLYATQKINAVAWDQGLPVLVLQNTQRVNLSDVAQMTA